VKAIYRSTRDSWTGYLRQAGLIEGFSPLETVLSGRIRELSDADEKRPLLVKSTLKEEATFIRRELPARREVGPPIAVPPGHLDLPQMVGACGRRRCL
jgi:hypothetical protein